MSMSFVDSALNSWASSFERKRLCYEPDLGRVAASEAWEERHVAGLGIQINARDG